MPLLKSFYKSHFGNWKFRWIPKQLQYLEIIFNPGLENMVADHFYSVVHKTDLFRKGWDKLQISLWGRVKAIKMVIAPKFNFLFSSLPVAVPESTFKTLNK